MFTNAATRTATTADGVRQRLDVRANGARAADAIAVW